MNSLNLSYRLITKADVGFIFELYSDWGVAKHLNGIPYPFELDDSADIVSGFEEKNENGRNRNYIISFADSDQKCGVCVLNELTEDRAVLGFSTHPKFKNRGIASEAANHLIGIAQKEGFSEVQASPVDGNFASTKILIKLGFNIEAKNVKEVSQHSGMRVSTRWIKRLIPNKAV
ncbi:MAG: GNAT family N-acetyltransferase [Verrucomicrobiota bacterium]